MAGGFPKGNIKVGIFSLIPHHRRLHPVPSKIEWTNETWNPITGCTRVSPGCDHCYMFSMYPRLKGMKVPGYQAAPDVVTLLPERLDQPLQWKRPRMIFVCSMSDLFHPHVPYSFISRVFVAMTANPRHTFQVLTKRPGRMAFFANMVLGSYGGVWPDNVWAGTSVESAKYLPRLDVLARVPAKVRFVSAEPLLGPLDLRPWLAPVMEWEQPPGGYRPVGAPVLSWCITGGESGPGARPMHPQWARDIRDQCQEAGVAYFHKQNGEWRSYEYGDELTNHRRLWVPDASNITHRYPMVRVGKKTAGALLDGREHREMPR